MYISPSISGWRGYRIFFRAPINKVFDGDFVIVRMLSAAPYNANVRYRAVMLLAKPNFILV